MKSLFLLFIALSTFQLNSVKINLDEKFVINKSEQAILESKNIIISIGKINDSRCPENTNCVWAGELAVDLAVTFDNKSITKTLVIPAIGRGGSKAIWEFEDYTLTFQGEDNYKTKKLLSLEEQIKSPMKLSFILSEK